MAYSGLRVGEVCKLKTTDIDFEQDAFYVNTEKQCQPVKDYMPMSPALAFSVRIYTRKNKDKLERVDGKWLFPQRYSTEPVSTKQARDVFSEVRRLMAIDKTYATANDALNPCQSQRGARLLYNYTPHSLRHWFRYKLDKANVPFNLAEELMRHSLQRSMGYGKYSLAEKKEAILKTFG